MTEMQGVYKITSIVNNRIYIGSSVNIEWRWNNHIADLTDKKHRNILLQKDWNLHGVKNFTFEVIKLLPNISKLDLEKEEKLVLDNCPKNLVYNINLKVSQTEKRDLKKSLTKLLCRATPYTETYLKSISTDYHIRYSVILSMVENLIKCGYIRKENDLYIPDKERRKHKSKVQESQERERAFIKARNEREFLLNQNK